MGDAHKDKRSIDAFGWIVVALITVSLLVSIRVKYNDSQEKQDLKSNIDTLQTELHSLHELNIAETQRDTEAKKERAELEKRLERLQSDFQPVAEIAKTRFPNIEIHTAVKYLIEEIDKFNAKENSVARLRRTPPDVDAKLHLEEGKFYLIIV